MKLLIFLSVIFTLSCLGREGTYVMKIKIYLDEDSFKTISQFTKRLLNHQNIADKGLITQCSQFFYVQKYFGLIFDEVNAQFKDTDIQFLADFSHLLRPQFKNLKEKYCVKSSNMVNIAQSFLSEFAMFYILGENKILIINCKGNNPFMPIASHMAFKNPCGKVHGILLADPAEMRKTIIDGISNIFFSNLKAKAYGTSNKQVDAACEYVHKCNRFFPDTGMFVKDLKSIGHNNDLEEFNKVKNSIWSIGNDFEDREPINTELPESVEL